MCGIVGAVAKRSVKNFLIEGLKKLEYRGYDSAGVAFISKTAGNSYEILRDRCLGRVSVLENSVAEKSIDGCIGIAHTRWATHGKPSVVNAHPHMSGTIAMVHNGIIENYAELKSMLIKHGYIFTSETDTEVFVHLVNYYRKQSCGLLEALQQAIKQVKGAYGTAIIDTAEPDSMVVARCGSPLVIGLGQNENFVASDQIALLSETSRFIYLKDGDTARITGDSVTIYDSDCNRVEREITVSDSRYDATDKNGFSHYMEKEIHEQPVAIRNTLDKRIANGHFIPEAFGSNAVELFGKVRHIQIVACGTSYHAGLIAKYWTEQYLNVSCSVEIAS
ncbi:glutamine--fructose-6-phosphate transaminase (isomerizing), partial [Ruminobacter sp. RM87]|uniref:glutamine--fructose-6-phosphate transaminase (isomerizing) n=1 Tax=Ruminobacter sp. RM87 TaxID=1200567 RepID=UPI0004E19A23